MNERIKWWCFRLGTLSGVLLILFGAAEMLLRLTYKQHVVLFPRYHTGAEYGEFRIRRLRPNAEFWHTSVDGSWRFSTNSQGLRAVREYDYEKPKESVRIICLGDSHTMGFEVRQDFTYASIIRKRLQSEGREVEVINSGVSGFGTAEQLVFLENEGIRYDPDFVVLGFFANDFQDNIKSGLFQFNNEQLSVIKQSHLPGVAIQDFIYTIPGVQWMGENSYAYSMLFNGVWNTAKRMSYTNARQAADDEGLGSSDTDTETAVATTQDFTPYEISLTEALLARMHQFCQDRAIQFIILDIPQTGEGGIGIQSSIPEHLVKSISQHCDQVVLSEELLKDYDGVAELHVANGHRHISEFSHTILGLAIADGIQSDLESVQLADKTVIGRRQVASE